MSYLCLNGLARWLLGDFYRTLLQAKCKQLFFRLVRQKCSLNISGVFKIVNKRKNDYKLLKLFKKKHWRKKIVYVMQILIISSSLAYLR